MLSAARRKGERPGHTQDALRLMRDDEAPICMQHVSIFTPIGAGAVGQLLGR